MHKQVATLGPDSQLRYDAFTRMLARRRYSPASILEIGCGQGRMGTHLRGLTSDYLGVEPDAESFEVARQRMARMAETAAGEAATGETAAGTVRNVGFEALAGERRFDLVCAFEVLEHLFDHAGALDRWAALVKPGGVLVVTVPGFEHRFGPHDELAGHFRRYEPDQLEELFAQRGLEDVEVTRFGFPSSYLVDAVGNRLARRQLDGARRLRHASMHERTTQSGRMLEAPEIALTLAAAAGSPARLLQRVAPDHGPNLIASGRVVS